MTDNVKYETRVAHTVRGMEARTRAKWEGGGWELAERSDASMFRTRLTFRRVKKQVPAWIWIAGGAVAASLVAGILVGSSTGDDVEPAIAATTPTATEVAASDPTPTLTTPDESPAASPSATATSKATGDPVTRKQVLAAFRSYFAERAAANVMVGKAVTKVSFKGGVVKVTFDPTAVGLSQESFDEVKGFDNLAEFAATPIAFADKTGNRLRPVIDAINTVTSEGAPLGTYSRADILALNELTE